MSAVLSLRNVESGYGSARVLQGLSLDLMPRQVITLLGRNGMGKSTTIKTIMGLLRASRGSVALHGDDIGKLAPHQVARAGIGWVPEGRQVFGTLSVRENLVATARASAGKADDWSLARVYELFPRLRERSGNLASHLSGGEQQMLAIGRALMTNPRVLILDEATEGLAPLMRGEIWTCIEHLKRQGLALIVVDKNIGPLLRLADRHYVVSKGAVVWEGDSGELRRNPQVLRDHVGV